jgi:hypothetical protein
MQIGALLSHVGDWASVVPWPETDTAGIPATGFHDHDHSARPR